MNWILLFLLDGRASSGRAFWLDPKEAKQRHSAPIIPPNYYRSFNLIRIIYIYYGCFHDVYNYIYIYSFISYIGYIYIHMYDYVCTMCVLCMYVCIYIWLVLIHPRILILVPLVTWNQCFCRQNTCEAMFSSRERKHMVTLWYLCK